MKNLITTLFIAVLAISFTSCSKKSDPKPEPVKTWIMGKWVREAETTSVFSLETELYFTTDKLGYGLNKDNAKSDFNYTDAYILFSSGSGAKWQINKISDTKISIGTPNVTVLTYYNKQ